MVWTWLVLIDLVRDIYNVATRTLKISDTLRLALV